MLCFCDDPTDKELLRIAGSGECLHGTILASFADVSFVYLPEKLHYRNLTITDSSLRLTSPDLDPGVKSFARRG